MGSWSTNNADESPKRAVAIGGRYCLRKKLCQWGEVCTEGYAEVPNHSSPAIIISWQRSQELSPTSGYVRHNARYHPIYQH